MRCLRVPYRGITTVSSTSVRWCDEEANIDNMNDLTGRMLQEFKTWRRDENGLKPITLHGQLGALRIFLRWGESIDAVEEGLHDKIVMSVLNKDDEQSEDVLRSEDTEKVLASRVGQTTQRRPKGCKSLA